ncbi:MAG: PspC domain-containing protein [Actinomycetales bacterium]
MTTNTTERQSPTLRPWHELRRSRDDSKIAGVCGGLARWLDVDPLLVRVVLVALVVVGGIGVLAYAILWLTVPSEDEAESPAARLIAGRGDESVIWPVLLLALGLSVAGGSWLLGNGNGVGLALVAVVVTFVLLRRGRRLGGSGAAVPTPPAAGGHDGQPAAASFAQGGTGTWQGGSPATTGMGSWEPPTLPTAPTVPVAPAAAAAPRRARTPRSPLPRVTYSLAAVAVGLTLAWGALTGGSVPGRIVLAIALTIVAGGLLVSVVLGLTGRPTGSRVGLVLVGAVLAMAVGSATVWHTHSGSGTRSYVPTSDAALAGGYEQGAGDLRLDLRQLPVGAHRVHAELGVGTLVVTVPPEAAVHLSAEAGAGEVQIVTSDGSRDTRNGLGVSRTVDLPASAGSTDSFDLDLQVGLGQVEVRRG